MRKQTWREWLKEYISDPSRRNALVEKMGVNVRTLNRWVLEGKVPLKPHLEKLLDALPQHRDELLDLLREEFPDLEAPLIQPDESVRQIPNEFLLRALSLHARTADPTR